MLIIQNVQFDIREKCLNAASLSSKVSATIPAGLYRDSQTSAAPGKAPHLDKAKGTGAKDANLSTYPRTQGDTRHQTPPPANPFVSSPSL